MSKLTLCITALVLAGCASMSEWRGLRIDGASESTLRESVARLEQELPRNYHRRMFALALADLERTVAHDTGKTYEDLRAELDGLTYTGVIALADQTGAPITRQYYSAARPDIPQTRYGALPGPAPSFDSNGQPSHGTWATGWPAHGLSSDDTVVGRPDSR